MDLLTFFLLIIIGILAGTLSGIVGVGGGIIIIPLLMLFLGMDQVSAQGTSIAILLPPVGILAAFNYYQSGNMSINYAIVIALSFVLGGYFGSKIALNISPQTLRKIFAIIMLITSIKMFFSR